jgi:hypothetical protein
MVRKHRSVPADALSFPCPDPRKQVTISCTSNSSMSPLRPRCRSPTASEILTPRGFVIFCQTVSCSSRPSRTESAAAAAIDVGQENQRAIFQPVYPPLGIVRSYVVCSESDPRVRLIAEKSDRSSITPPPVAAWLRIACSVIANVPAPSGDSVATVRKMFADAPSVRDPVGRTLSVAYSVVSSVTSAVCDAASAVFRCRKRGTSCSLARSDSAGNRRDTEHRCR